MKKITIILTGYLGLMAPIQAHADSLESGINYDKMSFLEEPLAIDLGAATFSTRALVDQSIEYDTIDENDKYNTRINADFTLETQLPNNWQAGIRYFSDFNRLNNASRDKYEDNIAFFFSDEIGTFAFGNVTNSVFENTRRMRSVGNADLTNNKFLGDMDETGAYYAVRLNSYILSLVADQEGRAEGSVSYERNIGEHNIFVSGRLHKGEVSENGDIENVGSNAVITDQGKTYGAAAVGSFTYGALLFDSEVGYEVIDTAQNDKNDHPFASVGMSYKIRALSLSAEGGVAQYDNNDLRSAALGARYDIARGLSLNMGLNYTYVDDNDKMKGISSFRYEF